MGPFPASINALCNPVRPFLTAAGTALVREGARNLVVILRKSIPLLKTSPVDEAGCLLHAPGGAKYSQFKVLPVSVHKPAHADIHHNPQRQEHEQY